MATRSKEVAKVEESKVPALRNTPAMEIESEDIALPKMKLGQYTSDQVKDQLVVPGAVFSTTSADDGDPQILWNPKNKGDNPGVVVHILGMTKGKSLSEGGELQRWAFNDPTAPREAWVTYNYLIAIPEFDDMVPYKWLLTKSGKGTAQTMNMVISKAAQQGTPPWDIAFEVKTAERSNAKGEWFVPVVTQVEAKPANVEIALRLAAIAASQPLDDEPTGNSDQYAAEQPAI